MTQHTNGLLHVGGGGTIIYADDGFAIANASVFHGRIEPASSEANARRLVACWNACEGVSTETLERMPLPFGKLLSQDLKSVTHQRDLLGEAIGKTAVAVGIAAAGMPLDGPTLLMLAEDIAEDHKRITEQRDALLEAMIAFRASVPDNRHAELSPVDPFHIELEALAQIDAAIAAAQGGRRVLAGCDSDPYPWELVTAEEKERFFLKCLDRAPSNSNSVVRDCDKASSN